MTDEKTSEETATRTDDEPRDIPIPNAYHDLLRDLHSRFVAASVEANNWRRQCESGQRERDAAVDRAERDFLSAFEAAARAAGVDARTHVLSLQDGTLRPR